MFCVATRTWNGLTRIARQISVEGEHFVTASRIGLQGAVNLVCLYHRIHLSEDDLEEKFIKGWGPGGQKVNKSSNCVQLLHKPTGITIKCHESRLLARNRVIAREILREKLDLLYNEKDSVVAKNIAKIRKRKAQYARKRRQQGEAYAKGSQNIDPGPSDLDKG
ncbi:unnamed protein product [Pocillopora meandrina]|uniref:Prokaryotic-type class I peptide chain release factors domain-containing protein n=1 Tax=Pocillopora meandrina TaxID=46732 RepID=A0AAU9WD66_9CNID|nr:unnamed protein product [Pocillopora meandrina]